MTAVRVEYNNVSAECNYRDTQRPSAVLTRGERARWWRRLGRNGRFWYAGPNGERVTDPAHIERIRKLRIPPAWQEVRVAPRASSRLQAIGIDGAGRAQYLYAAGFTAARQKQKYARIERFSERLPALRRMANEHIAQSGLGREKVLAVIIRLINELYFRVGSEESVSRYRTFGITTLRNRHLTISKDGELLFRFVAKHHIPQRRILVDEHLAQLVAEIKAIGGSRLFQYLDDDGKAHPVTAADVNRYIKMATGSEFSAKDFRTWGGTLNAAIALAECGRPETEREARKNVVAAIKRVAERLGNTPSVCRSCYIHPIVFERYLEGHTLEEFRSAAQRYIRKHQDDYDLEELELIKLFRAGGPYVPLAQGGPGAVCGACVSNRRSST